MFELGVYSHCTNYLLTHVHRKGLVEGVDLAMEELPVMLQRRRHEVTELARSMLSK